MPLRDATLLLAFAATCAAKEVTLFARQDAYVERQRPTWSYRTSILQVGKLDGVADAEYRAFLDFDLSAIAAAGSRVLSAKLRLHPLLATSEAQLSHHACLLEDTTWHADDLTWQTMPDKGCAQRASPCCGDVIGSWDPKPSKPAVIDITYYVKVALGSGANRLLAIELFAPVAASSREHYFVQYGSSRRGDASSRPELLLDVMRRRAPSRRSWRAGASTERRRARLPRSPSSRATRRAWPSSWVATPSKWGWSCIARASSWCSTRAS